MTARRFECRCHRPKQPPLSDDEEMNQRDADANADDDDADAHTSPPGNRSMSFPWGEVGPVQINVGSFCSVVIDKFVVFPDQS